MRAIDISFTSPEENIACDDALLQLAEKGLGGNTLRFWEARQVFVVLGRIGKVDEDVHQGAALKDSIPILRRSSGGGTVLQGPGCLNYTLILSKQNSKQLNDLRLSYQWILGQVVDILGDLGIDCEFKPVSDIALKENQKKFSGNAQKRARNFIMHHGTILYDFNLSLIEKYLKMPRDIPDYRQGRPHLDFVANIPVGVERLKEAFCKKFKTAPPAVSLSLRENSILGGLLEKYEAEALGVKIPAKNRLNISKGIDKH